MPTWTRIARIRSWYGWRACSPPRWSWSSWRRAIDGAGKGPVAPSPCGLTTPIVWVQIRTNSEHKTRTGPVSRDEYSVCPEAYDAGPTATTSPDPATARRARRRPWQPAARDRDDRYDARRRPPARRTARDCSSRRGPPCRGGGVCGGSRQRRMDSFSPHAGRKTPRLARRGHGARRKRRPVRARPDGPLAGARAAADRRGGAAARSLMGDGRSAALPRRWRGDRRTAPRRARHGDGAAAFARRGRERRARTAAARLAWRRRLYRRHALGGGGFTLPWRGRVADPRLDRGEVGWGGLRKKITPSRRADARRPPPSRGR